MPLPSTDRFNGSPLLPVYLVCDTSTSMGSSSVGAETPIKILNDSIDSLMEIIIRRGNRDIDIHLGIIAFSRFATVVRPLGRIDPREKFKSSLKAEGPTCYEAGLSCLEKCLDEDEENRGRREAARPLCFFLTDGQPTDIRGSILLNHSTWSTIASSLRQRKIAPRIIPCALGRPLSHVFKELRNPLGADCEAFEQVPREGAQDVGERIARIFSGVAHTITFATERYDFNDGPTEVLDPNLSDTEWARIGRTKILNSVRDGNTRVFLGEGRLTAHFQLMEQSVTRALADSKHHFSDIGNGLIER